MLNNESLRSPHRLQADPWGSVNYSIKVLFVSWPISMTGSLSLTLCFFKLFSSSSPSSSDRSLSVWYPSSSFGDFGIKSSNTWISGKYRYKFYDVCWTSLSSSERTFGVSRGVGGTAGVGCEEGPNDWDDGWVIFWEVDEFLELRAWAVWACRFCLDLVIRSKL